MADTFTGLRFILINAAVIFTGCNVTDRNSLFSYRAPTSGQSLADAATVSFVWTGNVLKPPPPANVRGTRDSQGNLLIQWTRRSRIGFGMIPGSDVPLAEEAEHYEVEILDGSNNVLRTLKVDLKLGQPASLIATDGAANVVGNSLIGPAIAYTTQKLDRPGSFIEARLSASASSGIPAIQLLEAQNGPRSAQDRLADEPVYRSSALFLRFASPLGITVNENALGDPPPTTQKFTSGSLGGVTAVRVRVVVNDSGTVSYYWDYAGEGSVPFYVSDTAVPLPVVGVPVVTGVGGQITDIFIGQLVTPSATLTTADQTALFGSLQSSIRVRVYQLSAIVGRGDYAQANI